MIVTFVSQCEKKSLAKTRRVLDAYANRIGDNVWQTIITEEGLLMVKKLLRRTATKNTAVSCHWIRSRRRSDLLWIVGNRNKFNSEGIVPVNTTQKKLTVQEMEDDWQYLPMIKALTAIAALLHDWGKCSDLFQAKLTIKSNKFKGDPIRHEWISCLLLQSLIILSGDNETDEGWLKLLANNEWNEKKLIKEMQELSKARDFAQLKILPPLAQIITWIIVSHHRLPTLRQKYRNGEIPGFDDFSDDVLPSLADFFEIIQSSWGYENNFDESFNKLLPKCFKFSNGLLKDSPEWISKLKRWSKKLLDCTPVSKDIIGDGSWRAIAQYSRLSLMLGDHYFSSLPAQDNSGKPWQKMTDLMANTDKKTGQVKQYLDQHLCGVYQHGLNATQYLKNLTFDMPFAHDLKKIQAKSPNKFAWQDNAVSVIKKFRKEHEVISDEGWFIVNMASTGTGKTIANAKIMQALSEDGNALRYILALGLRTLTLQTGDSYRENLGMDKDDLAVLIGSKAVQELHEDAKKQKEQEDHSWQEEIGSESLEALLDEEIDFSEGQFFPDFMNVLFPKNEQAHAEKNKAFLYQPILVCTIDHIMAATETTRGGKYLLPYLRLLSSDLVIDEVDDFGVEDLIPLARLVHLAGMLGRKVMISSATIPPSLAVGFMKAYEKGFHVFSKFRALPKPTINVMWVDEFQPKIERILLSNHQNNLSIYQKYHNDYIELRSQKLFEQIVKQRAKIIECDHIKSVKETYYDSTIQSQYFDLIQETIIGLHERHHTVDKDTGKKISFGVVRVANIPPCVALTMHLLNSQWPENIAPRAMAYHSRQVLLLRSVQEQHLDCVLSRKEKNGEMPKAFDNPIIRAHIDQSSEDNIIFMLVATPVEEVGRDHDFDWAVIEPSSYRSIIQLSGRVLRHRQIDEDITEPNIALMQFNLKGLNHQTIAFNRPGFESKPFNLASKNLSDLIAHDEQELNINAIARIQENAVLDHQNNLADLEHISIRYYLMNDRAKGAEYLHGWLDEAWFLTGLPQQFYRFRKGLPDIQLFAIYEDEKISFCERNEDGDLITRSDMYGIEHISLSEEEMGRLWLERSFATSLYLKIKDKLDVGSDEELLMKRASQRYGEIMIPKVDKVKMYQYSDQLGMFNIK